MTRLARGRVIARWRKLLRQKAKGLMVLRGGSVSRVSNGRYGRSVVRPFRRVTCLQVLNAFPNSPESVPNRGGVSGSGRTRRRPNVLRPGHRGRMRGNYCTRFGPLFLKGLLRLFLLLVGVWTCRPFQKGLSFRRWVQQRWRHPERVQRSSSRHT